MPRPTAASGSGESATGDESAAMRRLRRLSLHLLHPSSPGAEADADAAPLALAACAARRVEGGEDVAAALAAYLRGRHRAAQMRLFDFFRARPDLQTPVEMTTAEHRELCFRQLRALVRDAGLRPLTLMANDPAEYFAIMEAAGGADISLGVKLGVQYSDGSLPEFVLTGPLLSSCCTACAAWQRTGGAATDVHPLDQPITHRRRRAGAGSGDGQQGDGDREAGQMLSSLATSSALRRRRDTGFGWQGCQRC